MKLEPTLHRALLAGVARAPISPASAAPPALQALLAATPDAARLWQTLAATDLWQRAGFQPRRATPPPPACSDDAACPRAAEQTLQLMLRGIHADLLDGWLAQARALKLSLPHACLVPLLELATQKPSLRPAVSALLGERGQWLVSQHPAWAEVFGGQESGSATVDVWEHGSPAQRVHALQAMRRADPQAALAALERDWPQEPAENRGALLPCLSIGASLADEAFLERALDDKRKEVRAVAQQLLATLPGSQLGERCKARLLALFTLDRSWLGKTRLAVQLPQACDKEMKRDGIGNQPHPGLGEKAGWILDLMRCVPPTYWSETWKMDTRKVIDLLSEQEFKAALLTGLVQAAATTLGSDASPAAIAWFATLIGDAGNASGGVNAAAMLLPELGRLPLAEQERIVERWLGESASNPQAFSHAIGWARQRQGDDAAALSPRLSRSLLGHLQREMLAAPQPTYATRGHFAVLARALDAGDLGYAKGNWPGEGWEHWPNWRSLADDLMDTLTFRHTMQASFLENDA